MSYLRKMQKKRLQSSKTSIETMAQAAQALGNIDKVKDLNALLGLVQEVAPHLEETRTLCVMLIQEKRDLDRKVARQEAAFRAVLSPEQLSHFDAALEAWDEANPLEDIAPVLEAPTSTPHAGATV